MNITTAQQLAQNLLQENGLAAKGWHFSYDNATRRFGACHYGTKRITLSRTLTELNTPLHVKDTILHEIAHALAPRSAGHNKVWQIQALAIGCNGNRTYGSEVNRPAKKFSGSCPNCSRVITTDRRSGRACGVCCKKFNGGRWHKDYVIQWGK